MYVKPIQNSAIGLPLMGHDFDAALIAKPRPKRDKYILLCNPSGNTRSVFFPPDSIIGIEW